MRILITGGSGFIGKNLAEQLVPEYQVFAPSSAELDLLKERDVREYLTTHRFDVILHSATARSNRRIGAPEDLLDRNCRMFFNIVRNQGLFGKMVHFGSGAEYDRDQLPSRVREDYFDTRVPADAYGFSKYICAKYIERCERMVELRLFGVFGPYEDYSVRFISNACCRVLKQLHIVLRQDVVFDYLYITDLVNLTRWFIEHDARHKAYNVCSGSGIALSELAAIVAEVSGRKPPISVLQEGLGPEYTGDNSRLLGEVGEYKFRDMHDAIGELYRWYQSQEKVLDLGSLRFDEEIKAGAAQ